MLRRVLAALVVLVVAAGLGVLAWPQLVHAHTLPLVAQGVSFRAIAGLGALALVLVLLLAALVIRPFRRLGATLAVLMLLFGAATGAILAARGFGGSETAIGPQPDATDGSTEEPAEEQSEAITVLACNTFGDVPSAQRIADLALRAGADVVALPETSVERAVEVAVAMKAQGRPMWVTNVSFDKISTARSTSLLTSTDLGEYVLDESRGNTGQVPSVVAVPLDGTGPTIIAAHPVAPIPEYFETWRSDLEWLSGMCEGEDVIVAGDFNSTIDHYAGLSTSGAALGDCVDAASAAGSGAVGTWPARFPPLLSSPIDHVMSTPDRRAASFEVITDEDDAGSDHRPVLAVLVPDG